MATLRELKGRIGSVASSEKITGAMKMISSAKMHKAEGALRRLVPFRRQIETIIANLLSSDATFSSPLVSERADVHAVTLLAWGSDDGLCGAYNVNIYKQLVAVIADLRAAHGDTVKITVMPVGKKLAKACSHIKMNNVAVTPAPEGVDSKADSRTVTDFTNRIVADFSAHRTDLVQVLYMNFISAGRQRPVSKQLLPILPQTFAPEGKEVVTGRPYIFEPDANSIFNTVMPMFIMATMQDIFSQNAASEQAARVMAMQSANDNAKSLLDQLQLEYNKLRQQSITSELLDIVGGQVRD